MASPAPRPRRLLLPIVFAAILVGEVTGLALARSGGDPRSVGAETRPASVEAEAPRNGSGAGRTSSRATITDAARDPIARLATASRATPSAANLRAPAPALAAATRSTTGAPAASSGSGHSAPARPATYHGHNHVWIPSLGINRSVQSFPCSRSRPPDAGVYRWGCAGRNNVYLLSHAWSTFKPLHDAYVRGRLRKGMAVWYADGGGTVHRYSVIWWRVTAPTTAASWAWAAQSRPSMTLQTCVGSRSQYRLMVRLIQVG
jgi:hypothetical protein